MTRTIVRIQRAAGALVVASALAVVAPMVGAHTVAGHALPAPMAPCMAEDGSTPGQAFPCMWDAQAMGNGQGISYTLSSAE